MSALISIAEFQERFGLSRSTVLRIHKRGLLPFYHIGRSVRIRTEDVESWYALVTAQNAQAQSHR